jgi:3-mercaptopropionate dioxygenase
MTTTATRPATELTELVAGIRTAIGRHLSWSDTAELVADELRAHLPGPDVLTAE